MLELQPNTMKTAALDSAADKHEYFFDIEPNQPNVVTFVAPSFEYSVTYTKQNLLEKGGGVDAHDEDEVDFTSEETFTFSESVKHRIFLTVSSANESVLPTDEYTISLTVAED